MNVVANVYRGGAVESSHNGHIAVVDAQGNLLYSYGDPFRQTFARSAMKPLQAIPVVETGAAQRFGFEKADLALACASHNGEERHRSRAASMLEKAGQTETMLQCGTHPPREDESFKKYIKEDLELTPVFSNCSGKHSGMVATAVHMGEDPSNYHEPSHPVQQRILEAISDMTSYPKEQILMGTDGCGVPVHRLPLANLALAFARLAKPETIENPTRQQAAQTIADAMVAHPEMVGGKKRYCTDLMTVYHGRIVGKVGAEAVYCLGDRETGIGLAIKIEDGGTRVLHAVVNEVLRQLGIGVGQELDELAFYTDPEVKNMSGNVVGQIKAEFKLQPEDHVHVQQTA